MITNDKSIEDLRLATDEEKQQLFNALAKVGRRWNAEEKCIEDIPKLHEFRRNDPVLVRDEYDENWVLRAFKRIREKQEFQYLCNDGHGWKYCIPYYWDTEKLLDTPNPYRDDKKNS